MKNKSTIEKTHVQSDMGAVQTENGNILSAKNSRKGFIHDLLARIPPFPKFSDPAQHRVGGYIVNFMVGLFVLTLIVRGTSAATLARVDIASPTRNEIVEAITGKASVSVCDTLDIFAPEGLTVEEIFVGQGQNVIVGDAVALFDMEEVQEKLIRENADLEKLQLDLKKLERAEDTDSASLESAQRSIIRAHEDYTTVKAQGEADIASAKEALENAWNKQSDDPGDLADTALQNLQRAGDDYDIVAAQGNSDIATAEQEHLTSQADTDKAWNAYESAVTKAEQDYYSGSQQASDSIQSETDKAYDALEEAEKTAEQDYNNNSDQASDTLQSEIDKAQDAYTAAQKKAEENLLSAARRIEDAEAALAKAEQDFGKSVQQTVDTATQNSINAVTLRLDIEKQKSVVDILRKLVSNEGILYSDLGGTVSFVKAAGSTTNQDALVAFVDGAKGFEAFLQLDRSDAEKLVVGDNCVVTTGGGSMYYTPTVTGSVSDIALPDDQDKVQVTIRLPDGDWSAGQRVDVQAVQNKSTYDLCVPQSALHSDNTGYYLLVVEQKSSVLGIENTAVKVYVNIVASDNDMVAVQGPIDRNSQIITGGNKALAAGDRVRVNRR